MFSGLSAFPLTPMNESRVDETTFAGLMERLVSAGVDSIGSLGSTGNYAYLTRSERARIAELSVQLAGGIPVMVGIGALRTRDVLFLAEDAQKAGASGVLLPPMSYQKLSDEEVFRLYETVSGNLSVPLCLYDNPATTHFAFSEALHVRIAQLPKVASIKIPPVPEDPETARQRIEQLRRVIPADVSLGISGDAVAATGLNAGCEAWYSVIGGLFPEAALAITRAAQAGQTAEATRLSAQLEPIWKLYKRHGSLRVMATAAELRGRVAHPCLPEPLLSLQGADREELSACLDELELF
ncbi:dihydrodipicolinate synthase family protein [Fodinicurvata sediminis]|uniref:dihydrodipicolinate synthase family protein n=1 Tax=Fodinicurvata sediminis TaxID=1121832 RepID=UPI000404A5A0|nr:dihydrodipicolinate synthase family protein [Fodinicurvata sediminis]